jgi:hypothetical protein
LSTQDLSQEPLLALIANIVPILNGRDSNDRVVYLGPQTIKVHRYLLIVFLAKSTQFFRFLGKPIDNSVYFTLYSLGRVADSFKSLKPFRTPIHYDRTKVAKKIYERASEFGYVEVRKVAGDTYLTTTEQGDKACNKLLPELITYAKLSDIAPDLKEADLANDLFRIKKGISGQFLRGNANLKNAAEKIAANISELFKKDIGIIEDEP